MSEFYTARTHAISILQPYDALHLQPPSHKDLHPRPPFITDDMKCQGYRGLGRALLADWQTTD